MRYLVAKLPIKDGYRTSYLCRGDNWSTQQHFARYMDFDEAVNERNELRKIDGLTEEGRLSIVVMSAD